MPCANFSRLCVVRLSLGSAFVALSSLAVSAAPATPAKAPASATAATATKAAETPTEKPAAKTTEKPAATSTSSANPTRDVSYGIEEVKKINEEIRQGWTDNSITASVPAPENEWCRRVFLDLLGRTPSVQELQSFMADKSADRKVKLVDKLLNSEEYVDDYARNWTTIWTNLLIGRAGGTERNSMTSKEGMQKYLRDSFARNKPYDKMVSELVTATGVNVPGEEGFNGATNFLAMKLDEKGAQATAQTAKIFLGMQVQCTQCHNHPFNDWKQQKFWEFNAFFRQTAMQKMGEKVGGKRGTNVAKLVNEDFKGEGSPSNIKEAELYYELRNAQMKVAYPVFVDGTSVDRSGAVSDTVRRNELAKLIVTSKFMPEAMVNRLWQHFMGYGFTKPIDDMGPHNPPTHPALMSYLGERYRYKGFNTRELMKWIVLSEPYSLSSKFNKGNQKDDPTLGEKPKFSHYYMRQMRAEELYESLLVATEASKGKGSFEEQEKVKGEWLQQFVVAFGNDEGTESSTFNGTIPQALMMFNGDLIKTATNIDNGSFLAKIAGSSMSPGDKINYLYMAALARKPSQNELGVANQLLSAHKGNTAAALQDVWWAVLNSNEFILQH